MPAATTNQHPLAHLQSSRPSPFWAISSGHDKFKFACPPIRSSTTRSEPEGALPSLFAHQPALHRSRWATSRTPKPHKQRIACQPPQYTNIQTRECVHPMQMLKLTAESAKPTPKSEADQTRGRGRASRHDKQRSVFQASRHEPCLTPTGNDARAKRYPVT